ncbi:fumitremorgin C synthase [Aspergillus awamori]|uniref:Fumitremorgin C synthase n=1 Tax=Aspergillus awamori TaxID=105351 RepID=A0A401KVK6_ASPAW|nr:fumitremorgin C synthase [Aspergillus awamori]
MISILLLVGLIATLQVVRTRRQAAKLPPSPLPSLPIIGSLHQLGKAWLRQSRDWHRKYGPLITLKLGGQTIVLVGSQEAASELLGKRGRLYSSRPHFVMALDLMSKGDHTVFLPYGPKWKLHNRLQMSILGVRASRQYHSLQELETQQTLLDFVEGDNYELIFQRFQASLIHTMAYGRRLPKQNDQRLHEVEALSKAFINAATAGNYLVDIFPILKHTPTCLAPWKKYAQQIHDRTISLNRGHILEAEKTKAWNWVKHIRSLKESESLTDHELTFVIGSIYQAGVDTMTNLLRLFLMASVLNPVAVRRAQAELDKVVGNRLPSFDDMERLPFINAYVKEVIRWRPVAGLGAPHCVIQDDVYHGFTIPKGTTILANQFAMELDPELWEEPEEFMPERWLQRPDQELGIFGYGRRKCTGQYQAMDSAYIVMSRMLWAFQFNHRYEHDRKVELGPWDLKQDGNLYVAKPFRADIKPRDPQKKDAIYAAVNSEKDDVDIDYVLNEIGHALAPKGNRDDMET